MIALSLLIDPLSQFINFRPDLVAVIDHVLKRRRVPSILRKQFPRRGVIEELPFVIQLRYEQLTSLNLAASLIERAEAYAGIFVFLVALLMVMITMLVNMRAFYVGLL